MAHSHDGLVSTVIGVALEQARSAATVVTLRNEDFRAKDAGPPQA